MMLHRATGPIVARAKSLSEEVGEDLHLGRYEPLVGMHGIERRAVRVGRVRQHDLDQLSARQQWRHQPFRNEDESHGSAGGADQGMAAVGAETSRCAHIERAPAGLEAPDIVARMGTEGQAVVVGQLFGTLGCAGALQVTRAGAQVAPDLGDLA